jgi:small conductance mechanosensitive channel
MEIVKKWMDTVLHFLAVNFVPALLIVAVGLLVITLVRRIVKTLLAKSKLETAAHSLINSAVAVVLYLLLGFVVASSLGIDVTGVVAMASVLTLAVSLAVQNMLANILGGVTLLSTDSFSAGDFVEIAGKSGTVKEIGLTYTKLTTVDNKEISIPNNSVVSSEIVNYTTNGTRRIDILVTASYDSPIPLVLEALREAADQPAALETPAASAVVKNYADSSIEYQLFVWTKCSDFWATKCKIMEEIKRIFDEKGIEMSYPHLNVHIDK